jgi:hypothetical protein
MRSLLLAQFAVCGAVQAQQTLALGVMVVSGGFEALLDCAEQGLHPVACAAVWRSRVDGWLDEVGRARVNGMVGYYSKTLLQSPKDQRERSCRRP